MKDLNTAVVLTEKADTDNGSYRSAVTKSVLAAQADVYNQGVFDLSLLVAGNNAESYFLGSMSKAEDIDYFCIDAASQRFSRRPVVVNMEMPEGADYNLMVYDSDGNQVGIAVKNEDGTKTLTIPCDWSDSETFVIKISQQGATQEVQGNYKLTFSQGASTNTSGKLIPKEKREESNKNGIELLHKMQYDALPDELKYTKGLTVSELLEKQKQGEILSQAE